MKKMLPKTCAVLLSMTMALTLAPVNVPAAEAETEFVEETVTESLAEDETELQTETEAQTETETEAQTESEIVEQTEAETEAQTEAETASETRGETGFDFSGGESVDLLLDAGKDTKYDAARVFGSDRFGTSFRTAEIISNHAEGKHDNIVVAYGMNFPDALSGGYLTDVKNAPMLLINPSNEGKVLDYIRKNMKSGGTVYLLGGSLVIRDAFASSLKKAGIKYKRLGGAGRYDTNLNILKETAVKGDELLVARGDAFPDSLSGSAVGKPMLLVGKSLTQAQKAWLEDAGIKKFYILGGKGAVSDSIVNELKKTCPGVPSERVDGANRWDTSYRIARKFFPSAEVISVATGENFPDALSGAPLAMMAQSPIVLVSDKVWSHAHKYVEEAGIREELVFGGYYAINNATAGRILTGSRSYPSFRSLGIKENASADKIIDEEVAEAAGLYFIGSDHMVTALPDASDYDKAFGVVNYVGGRYAYGTDTTALGMVKNGSGTCFAYSELTYYMLKKMGVACWLTIPGRVSGVTQGNTGIGWIAYADHRTVVVKAGGKYYNADANAALFEVEIQGYSEPVEIDEAYAMYLIGKTNSY